MEPQKTLNSQSNHEKEQTWTYHARRFQTVLHSYSNKSNMVWHTDQWNRIESLEIDPCPYGKLIYNKEPKEIQ